MDTAKYEIFGANYLLPESGWVSVAAVAAAIILGLLIYKLIMFTFTRIQKHKHISDTILKLQISNVRAPLRLLFPAFVVFFMLESIWIPGKYMYIIGHLVDFWLIFSLAWLAIRIIDSIRKVTLANFNLEGADAMKAKRVHTQFSIINRVVSAIIIIIAMSVYLMTFPKVREVGVSLLASAGIIGIILGFAAQKTLGQLFAGITIAFSQPIKLDDLVMVGNETGRVEEITLTYVVIKTWDLRYIIVPITYFLDNPFQNWTRNTAEIINTLFLYTDYNVPVDAVRKEFFRLLNEHPAWNKKEADFVVTNSGPNGLELRATMSSEDTALGWQLKTELREKLVDFIRVNFPESLPKSRMEYKSS